MGVEFLLVLGLVVFFGTALPALAHADDDRPDPEDIKKATTAQAELNAAKREAQGLDQRAVEQSARLARDARDRLTAEKQIADARAAANTQLDESLNKGAALGEQWADLGKQKAASFTVTPKLNTAELEEGTFKAIQAGASSGMAWASDHWKELLVGMAGGLAALKTGKMWKARKGGGGSISDQEQLMRMMGGIDDVATGTAKTAGKTGGFWTGKKGTGGLRTGLGVGAFGGLAAGEIAEQGIGTLLGIKGGGVIGQGVVNPALASLKNMFGGLHMQLNEATAQVRAFTNLTTDEDTFGALIDNVYDTNVAWRQHGLEVEQIRDINMHLIEGFRRYSTESPRFQKDIVNTSSMMAILGVDAQTSAKNMEIMGNVMNLTGKESSEFTKEIAATADSLNMSLPAVMNQFSGMEDKLAQFGPNAANAMRELMVASRNTNIPMNDLLGTLDKFDTFDEAATAAGSLNAILGGEFINDLDLLNASLEGRTVDVMTMVQDALENSAVGWEDMGAAQRSALSQATGIGMANLARIARGDLTADMSVSTEAAMTEARAKEQAAQGRGIQRNIAQSLKGAETLLSTGKILEGTPQMAASAMNARGLGAGGGVVGDAAVAQMNSLIASFTTMWGEMKAELTGGLKLSKSTIDQVLASLKGTPITLQAGGEQILTRVGLNNELGTGAP